MRSISNESTIRMVFGGEETSFNIRILIVIGKRLIVSTLINDFGLICIPRVRVNFKAVPIAATFLAGYPCIPIR